MTCNVTSLRVHESIAYTRVYFEKQVLGSKTRQTVHDDNELDIKLVNKHS